MRVFLLPFCLVAFGLAGCTNHYKSDEATAKKPLFQNSNPVRNILAHSPPVRLYNDAADLINKPFRDLGEVTGNDCQTSVQDSPANINTARKRMQLKAANIKANAILVHQCEVITSNPGCYRQAVCQGSALSITQ